MNAPDISPLVRGALAFIGLAIALGQYPKLAHWAQAQAIEALAWKEGLPYFFAAPHAAGQNHHHPHGSSQKGAKQ